MKNRSIQEFINTAEAQELHPILREYAEYNGITVVDAPSDEGNEATLEEVRDMLEESQDFMRAQFTGEFFNGKAAPSDLPVLKAKEALSSSDVSIVMRRVISDILERPIEPELFLTNQVADIIELPDDAPLTIEFPAIDALQAFDMAEGQEYTLQTAGYQQHITSIRIKKVGVAAAMNEEVLRYSMWPLMNLHLEMMGAAINRKVESNLFKQMTTSANPVFDNEASAAVYGSDWTDRLTNGKKFNAGAATDNGTLSYHDIVSMAGQLLAAKKEATHFLAHPLAWPVLAQDPIMRAQFYHAGQMGAGIWTRLPDFDQSAAMPFGLVYVPYYALPYTEKNTLSGMFSGEAAVMTTDMYMIDRSRSLYMAQKGDVFMDEMDDWFKDGKMAKARKYVGISAKDRGTGMVAAKNIRIDKNDEPLYTTQHVTS